MRTLPIVIALLLVASAAAYDYPDRGEPLLRDPGYEDLLLYPYQFVEDRAFTGEIVIGESAPAQDVTSAVELAVDIQRSARGGSVATPTLDRRILQLRNNYIVVGGCDNSIARKVLDLPKDGCEFYFNPGEGYIFLVEEGERYHVVVAGGTSEDTNRAARALAQKEKYGLKGQAVIVKGDSEPYEIIFTDLPERRELSAEERDQARERQGSEAPSTPPLPPNVPTEPPRADPAEPAEPSVEPAEPAEPAQPAVEPKKRNFVVRFFKWIGGWFG